MLPCLLKNFQNSFNFFQSSRIRLFLFFPWETQRSITSSHSGLYGLSHWVLFAFLRLNKPTHFQPFLILSFLDFWSTFCGCSTPLNSSCSVPSLRASPKVWLSLDLISSDQKLVMDHLCGFDVSWIQSKRIPRHFFPLVSWGVAVLKQLQKINTRKTFLVVSSGTGLARVSCRRWPGLFISVWGWVFPFGMSHQPLIRQEQWHRGEGGAVQVLNFAHSHTEIRALLVCFAVHHPALQQQSARVQTDSVNPHSIGPVPVWKCFLAGCSLNSVTGYQPDCLHARGW